MLTITVRTYRPGDEPAVRKGGAVLPSSNAVSEATRRGRGRTTLAAIAAEAERRREYERAASRFISPDFPKPEAPTI